MELFVEDIGRVDGGFIESRLAAFGAALVTPVLLEFGALKWLLERHAVKTCENHGIMLDHVGSCWIMLDHVGSCWSSWVIHDGP